MLQVAANRTEKTPVNKQSVLKWRRFTAKLWAVVILGTGKMKERPDTPLPLQKCHETQRFSKVIVVCYRKKRDNKMMAVLKEAVVGRSMTLGLRLNSDASDKQQHEQHFCKRSLTR